MATLLLIAAPAAAERAIDPTFEITALGGGTFGGTIKLEDGGAIDLNSGWSYSAMLAMRPRSDEGQLIVMSYNRSRSTATFSEGGGTSRADLDVGYLQFGGEIDGRMAPHFTPFFGLTLGATHFSPTWDSPTEWFFSAGFYGGAKIPFGDHFGLRLQGGMMGTIISANSALFLGPGGALVTVNEVSGPIQGYLQAGVYVSF